MPSRFVFQTGATTTSYTSSQVQTTPRRPQTLTMTETRCSFHSVQIPSTMNPLTNKTLDLSRQRGGSFLRSYSLSQGHRSPSPFDIHSIAPKPAAPGEVDTEGSTTTRNYKIGSTHHTCQIPRDSKFGRKACWPTKMLTSNFDNCEDVLRAIACRYDAGTV